MQQLLALGKLCAYVEAFDNIPLDEQQILPVEGIDSPRDTESFQEGYDFAKKLAEHGLPVDAYHKHEADYCAKYQNSSKKHI